MMRVLIMWVLIMRVLIMWVMMVNMTGVSLAIDLTVERTDVPYVVPHNMSGPQLFGFLQSAMLGKAFPIMVLAISRGTIDIAKETAMLHGFMMGFMGQG